MTDILERLRVTPTVSLPAAESLLPAAKVIRQMMVERAQAADEIDLLRRQKTILVEALRVLPSKKAMESLREHHEAMAAMRDDDLDTGALGFLIELYDKVIRQMMVERAQAADEIDLLRRQKTILVEALRVLPSKKAMESLREHHEAMAAMRDDDLDTGALGFLIELYDKVVAALKQIGEL